MSQWTDSAKARLDDYFVRVRTSLTGSGADANEVVEDLRRHVEAEVATLNLRVVTDQDVGHILLRIGAPEAAGFLTQAHTTTATMPAVSPEPRSQPRPPGWTLFFFGVLLPLGTIGFEFFTGACAGSFFDPIPTLGHLVLTVLVPVVNLLGWLAVRQDAVQWRSKLGWANGFVLGIALFYALLFLPLSPFAVIGIFFFGFGLVSLAPILACLCAVRLRSHLRQFGGAEASLPGLWRGLGLGLLTLLLFTLPMILTVVGMNLANSESPAESLRGIKLLRSWGQKEELLRACYGRTARSGELPYLGQPLNPEVARVIYYRVTGQAFNSVPPPKLYAGRSQWTLAEEEFSWDNDQGGDAVAGRVRGLSLASSRQDGRVDPEAGLAYLEWTLEFKNVSARQREARAQILLPPGAVVSRLTLWIDGEEREAAFGGRAQVKTAYKEVVQRRRDPVLVTTCGPDRVLVQCFPVQPGGVMKARLGITAPLVLTNAENGWLRWPCFLERNFSIHEDFQHSLWLDSKRPLEAVGPKLITDQQKPGLYTLRGQVRETDLAAQSAGARGQRPGQVRQVWASDTRNEEAYVVRQTLATATSAPPKSVVIVVDGTEGMEAFYPAIAQSLTNLPAGMPFAVLLAKDGAEDLSGPLRPGDAAAYQSTGKLLGRVKARGGHDNLPALMRAWDVAAQAGAGTILWIHGPQPVLLHTVEDLRQRFERHANPPRLLEIQTHLGPNRVVEKLDGIQVLQSVPRLGSLQEDLQALFRQWDGRGTTFAWVRERLNAEQAQSLRGAKESSPHLVRLWAAQEVGRLAGRHLETDAMRLATRFHLVTPVSGAVVLETQAQYERAGLQPVPADSVPMIPEPSAGVLCLLGLGLFLLLHNRRKVQPSGLWM